MQPSSFCLARASRCIHGTYTHSIAEMIDILEITVLIPRPLIVVNPYLYYESLWFKDI
jgi:hypothetical protein